MCLAVPSKVVSIDGARMAEVDVMGVRRQCSLRLTPDVVVGDYVLVHAGFAIQRVEAQEAAETLDLLASMPDLLGDELAGDLARSAEQARAPQAPAAV